MNTDYEKSQNYINLNSNKDSVFTIKEPIIKNDSNNQIYLKPIMNLKKGKDNSNKNNYNLKKFSEEKSSERNSFENYSNNSKKILNLEIKEINNKSLISQQTVVEYNEKDNNIVLKELIRKKLSINNSLEFKSSYNNKSDKLIIKNKNPNSIELNINKSLIDDLPNNSFSYKIKQNKKRVDFIYKCLFCEKCSSNEKYNLLFTCPHFFCIECGKNFFEEVIDTLIKYKNLDINIKCPLMKCKNKVSLPLLKRVLSEKYYNYIDEHLNKKVSKNEVYKKNERTSEINIMKTEYIPENNTKKEEKIKYFNDNIINVNDDDKFTYYIKKTFILCVNCKKYSLYGNFKGNYDLCLNCLNKYCKFCHKLFEKRHFERSYTNHCRVVYRTYKDFSKCQCIRKYFLSLFYIIAGYLYLLTFLLVEIKRLSRIKNFFIKMIKAIFLLVVFILLFPLVIIIFPYYPIISSI